MKITAGLILVLQQFDYLFSILGAKIKDICAWFNALKSSLKGYSDEKFTFTESAKDAAFDIFFKYSTE